MPHHGRVMAAQPGVNHKHADRLMAKDGLSVVQAGAFLTMRLLH